MWPGKWGEKGTKAWEGAFRRGWREEGTARSAAGRPVGLCRAEDRVYRPEPDAWFWVAEYEFFGLTYSKC